MNFLLPACGEKAASGFAESRMRGRLRALRLATTPPHPICSRKRSQIDLSPHAGRGMIEPVLVRGDGKRKSASRRRSEDMPTIRERQEGPSSVFALATPQHMLTKLGWEIRLLRESLSPERDDFLWPLTPAYHAYNCAVTAWHLVDWTWCTADQELRAQLAQKFRFDVPSTARKALERFSDSIARDCRALHICRVIANGSKHMKVMKPDLSVKAQIKWDGEPHFLQRPYVTDMGKARPAVEVFDETFRYWHQLLASLGLVEGTFVSSSIDDD